MWEGVGVLDWERWWEEGLQLYRRLVSVTYLQCMKDSPTVPTFYWQVQMNSFNQRQQLQITSVTFCSVRQRSCSFQFTDTMFQIDWLKIRKIICIQDSSQIDCAWQQVQFTLASSNISICHLDHLDYGENLITDVRWDMHQIKTLLGFFFFCFYYQAFFLKEEVKLFLWLWM